MLFAQAPPLADPSAFDQFGPWGLVLALLLGGLYWRERHHASDLARIEAEMVRAIAERDAERAIARDLSDRLIDSMEQTLPILDRATRALDREQAT